MFALENPLYKSAKEDTCEVGASSLILDDSVLLQIPKVRLKSCACNFFELSLMLWIARFVKCPRHQGYADIFEVTLHATIRVVVDLYIKIVHLLNCNLDR